MTTTTYRVEGMTCAHCVNAVTQELTALPGVTKVAVELAADGPTPVTVESDRQLATTEVEDALDEAGDYTLV